MRHRAALILMIAALPETADAQRLAPSGVVRAQTPMNAPRPPTRFMQRMHRYGNWGTAIGTMTGFAVGMLTTAADEERSVQLVTGMMIGASVGNLSGLVVGLYERQPSDT